MSEVQAIVELITISVITLGVLGAATNGVIGAAAFITAGLLCVAVSTVGTIAIDIAITATHSS